MKRLLMLAFLLMVTSSSPNDVHMNPAGFQKIAIPCPGNLDNITTCPDTGCGPSLDPLLNRRKNIRFDKQTATLISFSDIKKLPDPVLGYYIGGPREKLTRLGEGKKVTVVAFALIARKGSRETCNCSLIGTADTDSTVVLVEASGPPTLVTSERNSISAELTPRVRLDHPGLSQAKLQPLIISAPNQALLVRVTGLLMFDSEHSTVRRLNRYNNWEIHPVFKLEYCPKGECSATSDLNWIDLDR